MIFSLKPLNILLLLAASASAFTPTAGTVEKQTQSSSTSLLAFDSELGAQAPLGFFDPLGLLEDADAERFERLRYVELKHGRISMLAVLGHMFTTGGLRLPGDIDYHGTSFASIPSGIAGLSKIPGAGLAQIFAFVGFLELVVMKDVTGEAEFPGDFRNGALDFGWDVFSVDEQNRKRAIELNNGRAAMMGILGLMVHEMLDNNPYVINSLVGAPIDFNAGL
ncbi:unnamed protein product [Cylindrotheca closterium]|uniref:Fucoxanthin-chlorophyll a/c light-harvesting protein n=1 Tax=Cylindrotheca closterium TaxID=2856 RepID=A0AAD2JPV7_9STRA|nr:unnamed protein product [Cylindrotheca closterium]